MNLKDMFLEEMRDLFGTVLICGYEYSAIDTLEERDPIAFNEMFLDWCDSKGIALESDEMFLDWCASQGIALE